MILLLQTSRHLRRIDFKVSKNNHDVRKALELGLYDYDGVDRLFEDDSQHRLFYAVIAAGEKSLGEAFGVVTNEVQTRIAISLALKVSL